jgi:hypothetical protein
MMTTSKKMKNPFLVSKKHIFFLYSFFYFCCCCCFILRCEAAAAKTQAAPPPLNLTAVTGVSVELRCKVRLQDCGNFYSIEWYRDNSNNNNGVIHDNNVNSNDDEDDDQSHRKLKTSDSSSSSGRGKRETGNQFYHSKRFYNNNKNNNIDESDHLRFKRQNTEGYDTPSVNVASERVYVYRHHSGQAKSEGSWESRAEHQYDAKRHVMTIRFENNHVDHPYLRCTVPS